MNDKVIFAALLVSILNMSLYLPYRNHISEATEKSVKRNCLLCFQFKQIAVATVTIVNIVK